MRCPECGYELGDAPDFTRCPECGTTSDIAERIKPSGMTTASVARSISLGYIPAAAAGLIAGGSLAMGDGSITLCFWLLGAVGGALIVFINTFSVLGQLMRQLPRRTRRAPVLLIFERETVVMLLGSGGAAVLAFALGSACCVAIGALGFLR